MKQIKSFTQLVNAIGKNAAQSSTFRAYANGYYHTEAQEAAEIGIDDFDITTEECQQLVSNSVWRMLVDDVIQSPDYDDYINEFGLENTIAAGLVAAGQCDKETAVWLVKEYV
jgi:hypothetical protein